jgi:hypothetical protein
MGRTLVLRHPREHAEITALTQYAYEQGLIDRR